MLSAFARIARRALSSVDDSELRKFRKLSSKWTESDEEFRLLRAMNPLRINFLQSRCGRSLENAKILDVGTGGARLKANVVGIDACHENIVAASNACSEIIKRESLNLRFLAGSIETTSSDDRYDMVVASEVLEHVADAEEFLKICGTRLNSGGIIFLSTISSTVLSRLLVVYAAEHILKMVPPGTHDPKKFVSVDKLEKIVKNMGPEYRLCDIQGVAYIPVLGQWRAIPSTAVNYFAIIKKM